MAGKKRKPAKLEPELIVEAESIDERTGIKTVVSRRGVRRQVSRRIDGDAPGEADREILRPFEMTQRQRLEKFRERLRDDLESKGLPSDRTQPLVSVGGAPFRPLTEAEMGGELDWGSSIEIRNWHDLTEEKTAPLSLDRACVKYLESLAPILARFDDDQLGLIQQYAEKYRDLFLSGEVNRLAGSRLEAEQRDRAAGVKSGMVARAKADRKWRETALVLAKAAWINSPELSQEKVAKIIEDGIADELLPGRKQILEFIREKIAAGELPGRSKL